MEFKVLKFFCFFKILQGNLCEGKNLHSSQCERSGPVHKALWRILRKFKRLTTNSTEFIFSKTSVRLPKQDWWQLKDTVFPLFFKIPLLIILRTYHSNHVNRGSTFTFCVFLDFFEISGMDNIFPFLIFCIWVLWAVHHLIFKKLKMFMSYILYDRGRSYIKNSARKRCVYEIFHGINIRCYPTRRRIKERSWKQWLFFLVEERKRWTENQPLPPWHPHTTAHPHKQLFIPVCRPSLTLETRSSMDNLHVWRSFAINWTAWYHLDMYFFS